MLAKRRSEELFTVRWEARGAVGFQGDRNDGTLFCPASPRPAVRLAPCRPDRCVSGFWTRQVIVWGVLFANCYYNIKMPISRLCGESRNLNCDIFSIMEWFNKQSTCRIQNPDIPQAGRVGAPGGAPGRGWARFGAKRTIRPGNKSPWYAPRHRRNVASACFHKHEQT